jgi:LacI family transcriptional regulator
MESNYVLIKKMLQKVKRPDGIISPVEKLVPAIYTVCEELNLNMPKDLKLVCFTNLPSAMFLNPPLTTITQPAFEMGKIAATTLFKRIEKKKWDGINEKIVVPSILIERGSTIVSL